MTSIKRTFKLKEFPKFVQEFIRYFDIDFTTFRMSVENPVIEEPYDCHSIGPKLVHTGEVIVSMQGFKKPERIKRARTRKKRNKSSLSKKRMRRPHSRSRR